MLECVVNVNTGAEHMDLYIYIELYLKQMCLCLNWTMHREYWKK